MPSEDKSRDLIHQHHRALVAVSAQAYMIAKPVGEAHTKET
jgi:hypothetical protein